MQVACLHLVHSHQAASPQVCKNADNPATQITMSIELPKHAQQQAITSIERYFRENMDEPIGNMQSGALLNFFLAEIGPSIYNKAVADVQENIQARLQELDYEVGKEEFSYWTAKRPGRK